MGKVRKVDFEGVRDTAVLKNLTIEAYSHFWHTMGFMGAKYDMAGNANVNCPFHKDNKPSLRINRVKGVYHCFSCGRGGDILQYYREFQTEVWERRDADFKTLVNEVFDLLGEMAKEKESKDEFWKKIVKPCSAVVSETKILKWNELLMKKMGMEEIRGLNRETLESFKIGLNIAIDRVSFPIYNAVGELVNVRYYQPLSENNDKKWINQAGYGEAQLYPINELEKLRQRGSGTVFLCAGEFDCLNLVQRLRAAGLGGEYGAITGTAGEGTFKNEWINLFYGLDVVIIYDSDTAGREGATMVGEKLLGIAKSVTVLDLFPNREDGSDLSDFFLKEKKTLKDLFDICYER